MRREKLIILGAIVFAAIAALAAAPGAMAAGPKEICADLADNGRLDGTYTAEELAAAVGNASVQGYCTFVVVLPQTTPTTTPTTTPPAVCTEVAPGTPGAVQAPNGKYYTGPNAHLCGPAAPAATQTVCVEVAAGTPGSVVGRDGKSYTGPNAHLCGTLTALPTPASVTPPVPVITPAAEQANPPATGEVAGQEKTVTAGKSPTAKAGPAGVAGQQSPLRTTRTTGTLPFTGAELLLFAIVGGALLLAGMLLRTTARQKARS